VVPFEILGYWKLEQLENIQATASHAYSYSGHSPRKFM
jgi:hypothetical protein